MNKLEKILIVCVLVGLGAVLAVSTLLFLTQQELFFKIGEHLEQQPVTFYEEFPEARVTASDTYQSIFATITIQCENYSSWKSSSFNKR